MEASSEFVTTDFDQKPLDYMNGGNNSFKFDDFLNFPKEDEVMTDTFFDGNTGISGDSSSFTVVDSCDSSVSGGYCQFNGNLSCRSFTDMQYTGSNLYAPCDDLDDLEWLSNFVEESFSSDDLQNLHIISPAQNGKDPSATSNAVTTTTDTSSSATTKLLTNTDIININPSPILPTDVSLPGKARSKRSRAAPCDWTSRLLLLSRWSGSSSSSDTNGNNNNPSLLNAQIKPPKTAPSGKREPEENIRRRCLHCASETTPQWRTGPMGPKTLCNACGVRYKSGRLVPEYRPASSPTFMSTKHSNSHRKVVELRRQKELQIQQQQEQQLLNQASLFGSSNGGDDFYNHHPHNPCRQQNFTPNYRLLI